MRFILVFSLIFIVLNTGLYAQKTVDSTDLINTIEDITDHVGPSLPFAAAVSGNNWDDAYIGTFPHFGIGGSLSLVLIPSDSVDNLFNLFDIDRPDELAVVDFMPLVLWSLDARIGTPISRFDAGFKIGYVGHDPDNENEFNQNNTDVLVNYALAGVDVKYAIVEQTLILPDISIGMGLNYYKTDLRIQMEENDYNSGVITLDTGGPTVPLGYPDLGFSLESYSVDFKGQISKSFFIFTPFAGAGASYGTSKIAGIMYSENDISAYESALETAGYKVEDNKISHEREYEGWSTRVFCGMGIGFAMLRASTQFSYNTETKAVAISLNGRIQF